MAGIDLSISDPHLASGGGLEETGLGDVKRANQGLSMAAYSQSEREQYNARVQAQNKMGISKLASMAGSIAGTAVGGPIGGAMAGMAAGMISSQLMS